MEFEKICTWFDKVQERDWFGAPNAGEARGWLRRCESLLEDFESKVFELQGGEVEQVEPEENRLHVVPAVEEESA
jgi:hypothetical protein